MVTKEKALYQVKLILDYLPEEEYKLISQETINYIEDNFEYDENFTINPNISLEKQKIDDKAYDMLDKIIKEAEKNKINFAREKNEEVQKYIEQVKEDNSNYNVKIEVVKLKKVIENLKNENEKIPKAKDLIVEYKEILRKKDEEIEKLKISNEQLYDTIEKIPKFIKKFFIKDEIKRLN